MAIKNNKNFNSKDKIIMIISLVIVIILVLIIVLDKFKQKKEINNLNEINKVTKIESDNISDLDGLYLAEVGQNGYVKIVNNTTETKNISGLSLYLNQNKIYTFPDNTKIDAKTKLEVETNQVLGSTSHDILSLGDDSMSDYLGFTGRYLMIPSLVEGQNYGFTDDTFTSKSIMVKTDSATNLIAGNDDVNFSVDGGYYPKAFNLSLSASEGKTIYYTTDGSTPTTESNQYTGPINISDASGSDIPLAKEIAAEGSSSYEVSSLTKGTVIRAIAVDEAGNQSPVYTNSYFISQEANSEVKGYSAMSITIDPKDFTNYFTGIYVKGSSYESDLARGNSTAQSANYFNGETKPVSIEYFEKGKDKTFEADLNLSIINDYSIATAQKSFLIQAATKPDYKGSTINNFFGGALNSLTLTTNLTDNNYKIREYLAGELLKDDGVTDCSITPVALFINGEYWGLYCLRANVDENYIANKYNLDPSDVVVSTKKGVTKDSENSSYGSDYASLVGWIGAKDMTVASNYERACNQIDMDSYIEFMATNIYLSNAYLDSDTQYVWRTKSDAKTNSYDDGKWRYVYTPLDGTMANDNSGGLASPTINSYLFSDIKTDLMFNSLLKNSDFRAKFIAKMQDYANNKFSEENVANAITKVTAVTEKGTEQSYKRFVTSSSLTQSYKLQLDNIKEFFKTRPEYILKYTNELN